MCPSTSFCPLVFCCAYASTYEALFQRIISSSERELTALRTQHADAQHLWSMERDLAKSKLATAHTTIKAR